MGSLKCFVFILMFFILRSLDEVYGDCSLSLNEDFGTPHPVLLQNGKYLKPNTASGNIVVRQQETITVACPGNKKYLVLGNSTTDFDVVEAKCLRQDTFRVGRWIGSFRHIRCSALPWFSTQFTTKKCYGGHSVVRVGYEIGDKFYQLYSLCFDQGQLTTLYSQHTIDPSTSHIQTKGTPRPNFIEGNLFGNVRVSQLYKANAQKARLNDILGNDMGEEYVTKKQFLTRGHLSPRADFSMSYAQRASFHYANAAPQWMRGNAGDWAAVEEGLRRRIKKYGSPVTVYTGTHGVVTLADKGGSPKEIYLFTDRNNNKAFPVPMYFYKVVYDPRKKTAAAFVSINSSYYNSTATDALTFCRADCDRHSWLTWRNDGTHSFCCDYSELVANIDSVPEIDVTGEFH